jgi:hypothetical protein
MLVRILRAVPDIAALESASGGVAHLQVLLGPQHQGVIWTTDADGQVIDFLDDVDASTEVEALAKVEARHGPSFIVSCRKDGIMKWAKAPPQGFNMKHEFGGLEVLEAVK